MILNKTYKERKPYLLNEALSIKYGFTLARQALYHYLANCSEEYVAISKFSPLGAFSPILRANKKIIFYDIDDDFQILADSKPLRSLDKDNTIFYYIHPFGLYIENDIQFIKTLKQNNYHVIDDRALTLPTSKYFEFADATLYSIYKSTGVPFGAFVSTDKELQIYSNVDKTAINNLHKYMTYYQEFYGSRLLKYIPLPLFLLLNKILHKKTDFNKQVDKSWEITDCLLEGNIINQLNYDMITQRRIEISSIYLENIKSDYLFHIDNISYVNQSIIGFPIKTDKPDQLYKYLKNKGIISFSLRNGWWMDDNSDPNQFYFNHLLLPIHHYLYDSSVLKVCKLLNNINI